MSDNVTICGPYAAFFIAADTVEELGELRELAAEYNFKSLAALADEHDVSASDMKTVLKQLFDQQGLPSLEDITDATTRDYEHAELVGLMAEGEDVLDFVKAAMNTFDKVHYRDYPDDKWNQYGLIARI